MIEGKAFCQDRRSQHMQIPLFSNLIEAITFFRKQPIQALLIDPEIKSSQLVDLENPQHLIDDLCKLIGCDEVGVLYRLDVDNHLVFNLSDEIEHGYRFESLPGEWGEVRWGKGAIIGSRNNSTSWSPATLNSWVVWEDRDSDEDFRRNLQEYEFNFGSNKADYGPGLHKRTRCARYNHWGLKRSSGDSD